MIIRGQTTGSGDLSRSLPGPRAASPEQPVKPIVKALPSIHRESFPGESRRRSSTAGTRIWNRVGPCSEDRHAQVATGTAVGTKAAEMATGVVTKRKGALVT